MTQKERLLKEYSDWLQMRNYALSTYKAYLGTIRAFWRYCEGKQNDASFEKSNAVQSYLAYRLNDSKARLFHSKWRLCRLNVVL